MNGFCAKHSTTWTGDGCPDCLSDRLKRLAARDAMQPDDDARESPFDRPPISHGYPLTRSEEAAIDRHLQAAGFGDPPRRSPHLVAMTCGVIIILIAGAMTLFMPAVIPVAVAAAGGIMTGMALALWAEGAP